MNIAQRVRQISDEVLARVDVLTACWISVTEVNCGRTQVSSWEEEWTDPDPRAVIRLEMNPPFGAPLALCIETSERDFAETARLWWERRPSGGPWTPVGPTIRATDFAHAVDLGADRVHELSLYLSNCLIVCAQDTSNG